MSAPFRIFSGVERAAVLMMLVGDDEAAQILQKLAPEEVRDLGKAMMDVADVSEAELDQVLDDFTDRARDRSAITFDPRPKLETVMRSALGPEKAATVLSRILPPESAGSLEALAWLDAKEIAEILETEHPQMAALLIANLEAEAAAAVLELLPEAVQPQIMHRLAKLGPVPPEAMDALRTLLDARTSGSARKVVPLQLGGTREAAKIMSSVKKTTEGKVMPKLFKIDKIVAREIEEAMFVFDHLLLLDDKNLGTLIRNIGSDVLTKSLKGCDEETRNRFLGCMSSRAADGIRDEMESLGRMKLTDVLDAQKVMIAVARGLVKDGTIMMPSTGGSGGDDEYV